jgi:hypothetical protein
MIMTGASSSFFPAGLLFVFALLPVETIDAQTGDSLVGLRLFFSEQDRTRLDEKRSDEDRLIPPPDTETPISSPKPKTSVTPPPEVELQGFVARSDGENTLWINNRAVRKGQPVGQKLQLISMDQNTGEVEIKMPNQTVIILQPGQRFTPETKKIIAPLN